MTPFGYLFILAGALLIRQVVAGRVTETPSDLRDLAIAFFNADVDGIRAVVSQRGTNVSPDVSAPVASGTSGEATSVVASSLVGEMQRLGSAANGYRWGATGPDYYDCSGLVWRAMQNLGMYEGPRFTTSTFKLQLKKKVTEVPSVELPKPGDIVLWSGKHIGVVVNGDVMYSARSVAKGITTSSIKGDTSYFGFAPTYWRVTS